MAAFVAGMMIIIMNALAPSLGTGWSVVIVGMAYGVHATLFFTCLLALWAQRKQKPRYVAVFLTYICLHFVLGTLGIIGDTRRNEMMFVDDRAYPGGPIGAYKKLVFRFPIPYMGEVVYFLTAWLQDFLLIYRCFLFYGNNLLVIVVPTLLCVVSMVMGSLVMAQTNVAAGSNPLQTSSINFFLTYWSCEVTTALLLTLLIVARLLHMRWKLSKVMGANENPYLTVSAILLESCALFSAFGLAFIITDVRGSVYAGALLTVTGQVQSIAPLLVILRVTQGSGITKETLDQTSSMSFAPAPTDTTRSMPPLRFKGSADGSGTRIGTSRTTTNADMEDKDEV